MNISRIFLDGNTELPDDNVRPMCIDLPHQIRIENSTMPGKRFGVFSLSWIKQGTEMGPYTGRIISGKGMENIEESTFMWEVRIFYCSSSFI